MTRILFLLDNISEGGAEKVLRTLVNNMDQSQFQITVQTVAQADAAEYLVPGIRYKAINRAKTPVGRRLFSYWIRLCAELKWLYPLYIKDDYDIEVAYLECGPTKFLSGSTNQHSLKLAWVHCDLLKRGFQPGRRLSAVYSKYDKAVCVSNTVRNSFMELIGPDPASVVLHNVNDETDILSKAEAFPSPVTNAFTFLFVGRLSHEKGADRLLEACGKLKESGKHFQVQILGDGSLRAELEAQAAGLGLQDTVLFLGFRDNPYPYMKAADCIVCTSRYEGFSTVVTEALILGKPVITTPCSGMDELLGDSEYGLITGHSADEISTAMARFLDDPQLCSQYAHAAKQRGTFFSKDAILESTQQFFLSELKKKRGST